VLHPRVPDDRTLGCRWLAPTTRSAHLGVVRLVPTTPWGWDSWAEKAGDGVGELRVRLGGFQVAHQVYRGFGGFFDLGDAAGGVVSGV
jgi:hypothetical protein